MKNNQCNSGILTRIAQSRAILILACAVLIFLSGCRWNRTDALRRAAGLASIGSGRVAYVTPVKNQKPLSAVGRLLTTPAEPGERTKQVLRRYNLWNRYSTEPDYVVRWMKDICRNSTDMDEVYALAEISMIHGDWAQRGSDSDRASEMYATALTHAWQFLFDAKLNIQRNAYDPHFRNICDVYNRSLEQILRLEFVNSEFEAGKVYRVGSEELGFDFKVEIEGRWNDEAFQRFEFVRDYQMQGLKNRYHTFGLGVPLIAVHNDEENPMMQKYYPPNLSMPMTALVEIKLESDSIERTHAVIKLVDPLEKTVVKVEGRDVPVESDITTPLAYHLNDPLINTAALATASMINADVAGDSFGLFMLEPFDRNKIPVVMIHGLWSNPVTWIEMFNDLRGNKDLRSNYQFWFYSYPTGQPFWLSAQQLRRDLETARRELDPYGNSMALNEMVLVGHSMGGLIARLQTVSSENHFWDFVSTQPIEEWEGDARTKALLRDTFIFEANPAVKRVVTIATPHLGSSRATNAAQWASEKLFTLPEFARTDLRELAEQNRAKLKDSGLLSQTTSVDSLAPSSPFFKALLEAKTADDVVFNNIIGVTPGSSVFKGYGRNVAEGDGVVTAGSAHLDFAESEVEVRAKHGEIHRHARSILEVRRALLLHLKKLNRMRNPRMPVIPASFNEEQEAALEH